MRILRLFLLVIAFFPLALGALVFEGATDLALVANPDPYVAALSRGGAFEGFPTALAGLISGSENQPIPADEREKMRQALELAAPPEWLESQARTVLDDLFAYVKGRKPALTSSIPVGELTDRFLAEYGKIGDPRLAADLRSLAQKMPRDVPLEEILGASGPLPQFSEVIRLGNIALVVLAFIWAGLALACAFLAGGFAGGARWVATSLVVAGILGLVASLAAALPFSGMTMAISAGQDPTGLGRLGALALRNIVSAVLWRARVVALATLGLAVLLYVAAAVFEASRRRATLAPAAPSAKREG